MRNSYPTNDPQLVEIHVELLEEGTDTWRPTMAVDLGGGLYRLLPTPGYDPENEIWQFLPGTIVRVKVMQLLKSIGNGDRAPMPYLVAIAENTVA